MINLEQNIWTLDALNALRYTAEQRAAIDAAMAASAIPDEFVDYVWSDRIMQRGGVLYLMRRTHLRGEPVSDSWTTTYIYAGWLYTSELDMNRDELEERIFDEIDRGENVFTHRPAGWA